MNAVGIMQGRLSAPQAGRIQAFPFATWRAEFAQAAVLGLDQLEWLVTAEPAANPLSSEDGIRSIAQLVSESGVRVASLCADFLISQPLVRVGDDDRHASIALLRAIIDHGSAMGVEVIVIPVLENGEIRSAEDLERVADALTPLGKLAESRGVRLAIETQLPVQTASQLIERCASPAIGVCYDVGNAAAAGHACDSDIRALGSSLFHLHIKDRVRNGSSVSLGAGAVDFVATFQALAAIRYRGALILETPVGNDAVASARDHLAFVRQHLRPLAVTSR
jgi:L-ribulose-5-phosphate 3-epimerase